MEKILFISHEVSRTGAPLMLLNILKWLRRNHPEINLTLVTLKGGSLQQDFREVVNSYYEISEFKTDPFKKLIYKFFNKFGFAWKAENPEDLFIKTINPQRFDLIYANSIPTIPLGHKLKKNQKNSKFIVHVHELETVIQLVLPNLSRYVKGINGFICVADVVKKNLIEKHAVPGQLIETIFPFSNIKQASGSDLAPKVFTVGGAGTVHWRKGPDLFVQTALYLKRNYPEIVVQFIWIGAISSTERTILEGDLEKACLKETVKFVGEIKNPIEFYTMFDIFLLPSREDPFPMVCIEAGILGKPIICFEGATGIVEALQDGGGKIVPYQDIKAMGEEVLFYYHNSEALNEDGLLNKTRFSEFIPEKSCPKIFSYLSKRVSEKN